MCYLQVYSHVTMVSQGWNDTAFPWIKFFSSSTKTDGSHDGDDNCDELDDLLWIKFD